MAATKKSKKERAQEVWSQNEYLKTLMAQIPEEKQTEVFEYLGDHVLRQDEFSRLSDEAATTKRQAEEAAQKAEQKFNENVAWRESSNKWLAEKQQELQQREAAITTPSGLDPAKFLTKEEAAKLTQQARADVEAQSLALQEAIDDLKARHFKEFGEFLPTRELIAHARKIGKPVDQAYEDLTRGRYDEKATKAQEKWKADTRAEIEKEVRSSLGPAAVYPVSNEPTTLAGLTPEAGKNFGTKAAVEAILRGEIKPQG